MMFVLFLAALAAVHCSQAIRHTQPKVQVYSRDPGQFGENNILICQVSGFHPPDMVMTLTENGVELPNAKQTDLAFKQDWHFHLTMSTPFTPIKGIKYGCKVTHGLTSNTYAWEPNM